MIKILILYSYFVKRLIIFKISVNDKETTIAPPVSVKKEESNKREITRDGEKEERNKKIRKTDSKENIPLSVEKKQVFI